MRTFIITPLTKNQVKELCFVIHNGKTEEERNNAKWELAYSFKTGVENKCRNFLKNIYSKKVDYESKNIKDLIDICYDVLFECAEKYDPEHSSGANLFTYARNEMKNKMLQATNPGMTETQIRNYNTIFNAKKYYEKKHGSAWFETEVSLIELSDICGLSVKVIRKTLALKRESKPITVSLDAPLSDNKGKDVFTIGETIADRRNNFEYEVENKKAYLLLHSLTEEETAILNTMVDINNNYKLISEREGVRLLEEKGFKNIGRGTLNSRREALKRKVWAALYETEYRPAA